VRLFLNPIWVFTATRGYCLFSSKAVFPYITLNYKTKNLSIQYLK
jgi:hypothetical protein